MTTDHAVDVVAVDQVNSARRAAAEVAREAGFNSEDEGRVALVATELATNLVKHGRGGRVLVGALASEGRRGVRVMALDQGPGIRDIARSMEDGISSAGSPGTGLGAIRRQSDRFDLWSRPDQETVVLAHLWSRERATNPTQEEDVSVGGVCVPVRGEEVCGDGWSVVDQNGTRTVLVTDGVGHGPEAQRATSRARELFERSAARAPAEIVEVLHAGMRSTRGAAVAVVRIERDEPDITFCGIGNIAGCILDGERPRNLVSHHGTVGHDLKRVHEFQYPFLPGATMVLNSDGLTTQWELDSYLGLLQRHPSVVASILYRDFRRERDDATAVVVRRRA